MRWHKAMRRIRMLVCMGLGDALQSKAGVGAGMVGRCKLTSG